TPAAARPPKEIAECHLFESNSELQTRRYHPESQNLPSSPVNANLAFLFRATPRRWGVSRLQSHQLRLNTATLPKNRRPVSLCGRHFARGPYPSEPDPPIVTLQPCFKITLQS